jgi:hypothetical protein
MNMSERDRIAKLLRESIEPVPKPVLEQDLWPRMLRKLDERAARPSLIDWLLAALALGWAALFPGVIPTLLYHF